MVSRFSELIVDSANPRQLAEFWCAVLGYEITSDEGGAVEIAPAPPDREAVRRAPVPPAIVFVPVPEGKAVKNRLHIDVSPADQTQAAEVQRLLALGAIEADIGQGEVSWVVMRDPEGNELCVLRSLVAEQSDNE